MSQPTQLYRLQQIDTELDIAHARLRQIEIALSANAALKQAQQQLAQAEAADTAASKELKSAESEVASHQQKIENNQRVTYSGSVTNPKELEDLQNEAAALARYMDVLEERQLEKMIAQEECQATLQTAQETLAAVQAAMAQQNAELTGEQTQLAARVAKLEAQRIEAAAVVPAENMATYTKLRSKGNGLAVSVVKDNICQACGGALTAAQAQSSRLPNQITRCSNCKRVLYSS